MVIPSTPALPWLAFTRRHASLRFSRSHTSSINRFVLTGLWGPCVAASDSVSSLPASRASPADLDEKSSSIWMFCCLSLSRLMSYSPLLSFGPSTTVPRSAYPLTPPFGCGVPHSPHRPHRLLRPLLTSALRSDCLSTTSVAEATQDRSPGVSSTAFHAQPPDLRFAPWMDTDFAVSCPLVRH